MSRLFVISYLYSDEIRCPEDKSVPFGSVQLQIHKYDLFNFCVSNFQQTEIFYFAEKIYCSHIFSLKTTMAFFYFICPDILI